MLIHGERIGALVRGVMPPGDGTREDDYPLARAARGGRLRPRPAALRVVMGAGAGIGLWIFGVVGIFPDGKTYALAFGAWFGLMELVPYVGPVLGRRPAAAGRPLPGPDHSGVGRPLFVGLQQIEGHIASPHDLRPRAAHQPAARRSSRCCSGPSCSASSGIDGAAGRRRRARDGRLPAPAPAARALGDHDPVGDRGGALVARAMSGLRRALRGGRRVPARPAAPTWRARKYRPRGSTATSSGAAIAAAAVTKRYGAATRCAT